MTNTTYDVNTPEYRAWQDKEYEYLIAVDALHAANRVVGDDNALQCVIKDHLRKQLAAQRIHDRIRQEYIAAANAANQPLSYTR